MKLPIFYEAIFKTGIVFIFTGLSVLFFKWLVKMLDK